MKEPEMADRGKHGLEVVAMTRAEPAGVYENTVYSRGILPAGEGGMFVPASVFTSGAVRLEFPADEMVMTWNATSPPGTSVSIEFAVGADGRKWSRWLKMADWKNDMSRERSCADRAWGRLEVDHFRAVAKFRFARYRAIFRTADPSQAPLLRRVTFCYSDMSRGEGIAEEGRDAAGGEKVDIDVPWLSQYDERVVKDPVMMEAGVCGATSVTMALKHWGIGANVRDVGRRAWDPVAKIYGNWAFLCAAASEYGPSAWVQRFSAWDGVRGFIEKGIPVIISISYDRGTMSAEPEKETAGHLLVVRGFTERGDVIVNDPGAEYERRGRGYVYPARELGGAFFGHGGVGIIICK